MSRAAVRSWAGIGVGAQLVFVVSWLLAGLWQGDRYSWLAHSISDMYAVGAPRGMFLVVVLTVCGLATVLFALLALRPALRGSGWPGTVGPVLLALSILGLGDLLSPFEREGCRLADPGCTPQSQLANSGGQADALLSTLGLVLAVTAGFLLAYAMTRLPAWQSVARPTRLLTIAVIVLLLGTFLLPGVGGLVERLLAAVAALGVALLAWAVRQRATSSRAPAPTR